MDGSFYTPELPQQFKLVGNATSNLQETSRIYCCCSKIYVHI